MASNDFSSDSGSGSMPPTGITIAGGFGAGTNAVVGSGSEAPPVATETAVTDAGVQHGDTSERSRFRFMRDDLVHGAIGAVAVADRRRLADSFDAVDYCETNRRIPYVVALNRFDDLLDYPSEQVREALEIGPQMRIADFGIRGRKSCGIVLTALLRHTLEYPLETELVG